METIAKKLGLNEPSVLRWKIKNALALIHSLLITAVLI